MLEERHLILECYLGWAKPKSERQDPTKSEIWVRFWNSHGIQVWFWFVLRDPSSTRVFLTHVYLHLFIRTIYIFQIWFPKGNQTQNYGYRIQPNSTQIAFGHKIYNLGRSSSGLLLPTVHLGQGWVSRYPKPAQVTLLIQSNSFFFVLYNWCREQATLLQNTSPRKDLLCSKGGFLENLYRYLLYWMELKSF